MAQQKNNRKGNRGRSHFMTAVSLLARALWRLVVFASWLLWRGIVAISPTKEQWGRIMRSPRTHRIGAGAAMVLAVVISGFVVRSSLAETRAYRLDPARIHVEPGQMTWLTGESRKRMEGLAASSIQRDLAELPETSAFDKELIQRVADKLRANPWVASVDRIERVFPTTGDSAGQAASELNVALSLRKPVIRVRPSVFDAGKTKAAGKRVYSDASFIYYVDATAAILPHVIEVRDNTKYMQEDLQFLDDTQSTVRQVIGVFANDLPAPGTVWTNEQIAAALSMERTIRTEHMDNLLPVTCIDVATVGMARGPDRTVPYRQPDADDEWGGGGGVRLHGGAVPVLWGLAPCHATTVEVPVSKKIKRLEYELGVADPGLVVHAAKKQLVVLNQP